MDPNDIIMGACNDCYAFAALSGISEALEDENEENKGERVRDNFRT